MRNFNSDIKNISNYYVRTDVQSVGEDLQTVFSRMKDSIAGVEIKMKGKEREVAILSPPYVRVDKEPYESFIQPSTGEFKCYEGYLYKPFFFPLYTGPTPVESVLDELISIPLLPEEVVMFQLLLRRRDKQWKYTAIDMYESYLQGNDYPSSLSLGRSMQDKTLQLLNRVMFFPDNDYVEEVEEKIMSEGYQFQLRVVIQSDYPEEVRHVIQKSLSAIDGHNALQLCGVRSKQFLEQFKKGVLSSYTKNQILSTEEVKALVGGATTEIVKPVKRKASTLSSRFIDLLPYHERQQSKQRDNIEEDIAHALKKVKLIDIARLYNTEVTLGIRLTVVQADIPKDINISHIISKTADIQAELGVNSLGVEQGSDPGTVRFTIPNEDSVVISLRELVDTKSFKEFARDNPLAFVVGVDEVNNPIYLSLSKLVHLLVAGTTGSGKSVFINSLIVSLLVNNGPDELQLIMIDPKEVELQQYTALPQAEVITDMALAKHALYSLVEEMDKRYKLMRDQGVKNIVLYNKQSTEKLPYIVCIIDEYADLVDTQDGIETPIGRLTQKARAAGIHLIVATQRPSVDIISGRIKAVIPNKISFNLRTNGNYKTVFGKGIPYTLLGHGDGVMQIEGQVKEFQRFQSAMISPNESEENALYSKICDYYTQKRVNEDVGVIEQETPKTEANVNDTSATEEDVIVTTEGNTDKDLLYQLKVAIATTRETRVEHLRKILGVKTTKITELMQELVAVGWLEKSSSRSKGYQLVASEAVLSEWRA